MPLVTVTLRKYKSTEFKHALLSAVHAALGTVGVHAEDRFHRVLELSDADFVFDPQYPDAASVRGENFVLIEIL